MPDLPDIKSFPGRLLRCILIFANGPSSARSSKLTNIVGKVFGLLKCLLNIKSLKISEIRFGKLEKSELIHNTVGVLLVELLPHQVSGVST